jgi:o-succinylbenzoate synthase
VRGAISVTVREIALQRKNAFVSSRATTDKRRIILTTVTDSEGLVGWGECSAPEEPRYCEEWTSSAWAFINEVFMPSFMQVGYVGLESLGDIFDAFRGNRMAKAAIEVAFWDLEAHRQHRPLWQVLGGSSDPIPCGVAIGIMNSVDILLTTVHKEVAAGYRRIKLKIRPGWDVHVVEAVRAEFPHIVLMVDANGAYSSDHLDYLRALDDFDLLMIEQPFPPDDFLTFRQAHDRLITPICLDESIVSAASTKTALELKLCGAVNVKLGRVGGHRAGMEIIQLCAESQIPSWCGGQHEAGVGRAHSLAMATLMPRILPAELSASTRYWDEDIISPIISVNRDGYILPPTAEGVGHMINHALVNRSTVRREDHVVKTRVGE